MYRPKVPLSNKVKELMATVEGKSALRQLMTTHQNYVEVRLDNRPHVLYYIDSAGNKILKGDMDMYDFYDDTPEPERKSGMELTFTRIGCIVALPFLLVEQVCRIPFDFQKNLVADIKEWTQYWKGEK
jgi:hypothetical protein